MKGLSEKEGVWWKKKKIPGDASKEKKISQGEVTVVQTEQTEKKIKGKKGKHKKKPRHRAMGKIITPGACSEIQKKCDERWRGLCGRREKRKVGKKAATSTCAEYSERPKVRTTLKEKKQIDNLNARRSQERGGNVKNVFQSRKARKKSLEGG